MKKYLLIILALALVAYAIKVNAVAVVYKTISITQEAYNKVAVMAINESTTTNAIATRMILLYKPTVETTFHSNNVRVQKGSNTIQAYLDNTDVSLYKIQMNINGGLYDMGDSAQTDPYLGYKVKSFVLDTTNLPNGFIIKFTAYNPDGSYIAEKLLNVINN